MWFQAKGGDDHHVVAGCGSKCGCLWFLVWRGHVLPWCGSGCAGILFGGSSKWCIWAIVRPVLVRRWVRIPGVPGRQRLFRTGCVPEEQGIESSVGLGAQGGGLRYARSMRLVHTSIRIR